MSVLGEFDPQVGSHFLPSQIISGTNRPTLISGSLLEDEEDETDDEDEKIGGGVIAL